MLEYLMAVILYWVFVLFSLPQLEPEGLLMWVVTGSLGLSLVLSFVIVPLCRFRLGPRYGTFLLAFYAAFLLIALLTEFGKIRIG